MLKEPIPKVPFMRKVKKREFTNLNSEFVLLPSTKMNTTKLFFNFHQLTTKFSHFCRDKNERESVGRERERKRVSNVLLFLFLNEISFTEL